MDTEQAPHTTSPTHEMVGCQEGMRGLQSIEVSTCCHDGVSYAATMESCQWGRGVGTWCGSNSCSKERAHVMVATCIRVMAIGNNCCLGQAWLKQGVGVRCGFNLCAGCCGGCSGETSPNTTEPDVAARVGVWLVAVAAVEARGQLAIM